jgi:hypothetical protein
MRIKSLHSKKSFWKFVFLVILVLGGSVSVILATQKSTVFDESEAAGNCAGAGQLCSNVKDCCLGLEPKNWGGICICYGSCDRNSDSARYGNCINNKAVYCTDSGLKTEDCNKSGRICVPGRLHVTCSSSSSTPKPSTPKPVVTCQYDCGTRYECNNNGGTIVSGKCSYVGEVCCKY